MRTWRGYWFYISHWLYIVTPTYPVIYGQTIIWSAIPMLKEGSRNKWNPRGELLVVCWEIWFCVCSAGSKTPVATYSYFPLEIVPLTFVNFAKCPFTKWFVCRITTNFLHPAVRWLIEQLVALGWREWTIGVVMVNSANQLTRDWIESFVLIVNDEEPIGRWWMGINLERRI